MGNLIRPPLRNALVALSARLLREPRAEALGTAARSGGGHPETWMPSLSDRSAPRARNTAARFSPSRPASASVDPTELELAPCFTSPDPSGQEKNPYLYAEGDPVNRIDPQGTLSVGSVLGAVSLGNDFATAGKAWNAALDGNFGAAAGITFGLAVSKAVEGVCIGAAAYFTGGTGAAAAAVPCMVAGEYAGSFAEDTTVKAWS